MSKTSRLSKINKNRMHHLYVNQNTQATNINSVQKIDPVQKIENDPQGRPDTYLLSSDAFYDKLRKLQKEYKKFYHDEQRLEKVFKAFEDSQTELEHHMFKLIEAYNQAIDSLRDFDDAFETRHTSNILAIIKKFENQLNRIGIVFDEQAFLKLNASIFREQVKKSEDNFKFLFHPLQGLIMQLYREFKNIKTPQNENTLNYKGLLLDKKS